MHSENTDHITTYGRNALWVWCDGCLEISICTDSHNNTTTTERSFEELRIANISLANSCCGCCRCCRRRRCCCCRCAAVLLLQTQNTRHAQARSAGGGPVLPRPKGAPLPLTAGSSKQERASGHRTLLS